MRHVVSEVLQRIRSILMTVLVRSTSEDLIKNDVVVGGPSSALQASMSLQVEVPATNLSDTTIHNSAGMTIGGSVSVCLGIWVEASVMTLATDDNRDLWKSLLGSCSRIFLATSVADKGKFQFKKLLVLAFRNTISVHEDVLGQLSVLLAPDIQSRHHHTFEGSYHFLSGLLNAEGARPLSQELVDAGNDTSNTGSG